MSLTIPNRTKISIADPKLGEALDKVEQYVNQNLKPVSGTKRLPPSYVTPAVRPG